MKDLVLKGFVKSFSESQGLSSLPQSEVFEIFSTSVVFRKFHACDVGGFDDFMVGGGSDGGIDAAAILVNGRPVRSKEDLDFFKSRLRRLDFEFVFIQAKTSPEFDSGAIGTFLYGISQFFSPSPKINFNTQVESLRSLKDEVYDLSIAMDENPSCHAYYVTTGEWNNNVEPCARINDGAQALIETHLFSCVEVKPLDASELKRLYRELERGVTREVELNKTAVFPSINGVHEAYLGLLSGGQFIRLVTNDEGLLNRELFYDNVRDYQGNNPVNRDIASTLSGKESGRFPLLNNGITVVARRISRTGDNFRISDFQIVNGCQTTHVLYQNREKVTDDIFIPIKLVVTDESEIITEVIKATNWQTAVMPEALESLTPFHKEIEDFYNVHHDRSLAKEKIYYERRSKQYYFDPIPQSDIVTLTTQTKSFVAMFLNEPHSHPRYYGELLKAYETRIFVADHNPGLYYASGLAYITVQKFFNRGLLPKDMRPYLYHLLMLVRVYLMGGALPRFNSNKAASYAAELIVKLGNEDDCLVKCKNAIALIRSVGDGFPGGSKGNPPPRLKAFTESLLSSEEVSLMQEADESSDVVLGRIETGVIKWFNDVKGYGFISRDVGGDVFVHVKALSSVPLNKRESGTRLRYSIVQGLKGLEAKVEALLC